MPDKADTAEENDAQKPPAKKKLQKRSAKKKGTKKKSRAAKRIGAASPGAQALYPRHSVDKALRIPKAILEQNAGKECSEKEAVGFLSLQLNGPSRVEINSGIKYGFLERPSPGRVKLTELGRKVLRPQEPKDVIEGFRAAVLRAPEISDVYKHYRGENLPDQQFFDNTLVDTFHIPQEKLSEFKAIFNETLQSAQLIEEHNDKQRVIDIPQESAYKGESAEALKNWGNPLVSTRMIAALSSCLLHSLLEIITL